MQKTIFRVAVILLFLLLLLPFGMLLTACLGYTVTLASYEAYGIITVLLSAVVVVLTLLLKVEVHNKLCAIFFALLPFFGMAVVLFYTIRNDFIVTEGRIYLYIGCLLLFMGCCIFLGLRHGKPYTLKMVVLYLSGLLVLPLCQISALGLIFGNIGHNTVVQTLPSPEKTYYAQVIDSDQGALGGDTLVWVYEYGKLDAVIFEITKSPKKVYSGDWGEYKNMRIHWENEEILVINGMRYGIP